MVKGKFTMDNIMVEGSLMLMNYIMDDLMVGSNIMGINFLMIN